MKPDSYLCFKSGRGARSGLRSLGGAPLSYPRFKGPISKGINELDSYWHYSRGQAKPANLVSRQGRYLEPRFFQILVRIC